MDYGTHREISSISRENFSSGEKVHSTPSEKPSIRDVRIGIGNECECECECELENSYESLLSHIGSTQQTIPLSFPHCLHRTILRRRHRALQSLTDYPAILPGPSTTSQIAFLSDLSTAGTTSHGSSLYDTSTNREVFISLGIPA